MAANRIGEEAMISEMPSAASAVCTNNPEQSPKATAIPVLRPWTMLWAMTNKISGPGIRVSNDEATINSSSFMCGAVQNPRTAI